MLTHQPGRPCGTKTSIRPRLMTVTSSSYLIYDFVCCAVLSSSVVSTLCDPRDCSLPGSSVQGDSPGKNTGVGCHVLQGIIPIEGSNPGLPHCRQNFYHLSLQGRPRILEWVAYSFSRGSFQPINWTGVSCIAGRFFTNSSIREAPVS